MANPINFKNGATLEVKSNGDVYYNGIQLEGTFTDAVIDKNLSKVLLKDSQKNVFYIYESTTEKTLIIDNINPHHFEIMLSKFSMFAVKPDGVNEVEFYVFPMEDNHTMVSYYDAFQDKIISERMKDFSVEKFQNIKIKFNANSKSYSLDMSSCNSFFIRKGLGFKPQELAMYPVASKLGFK